MNRLELMQRVRSLVRDLGNSFFREDDVINYLNEGIERVAQRIPSLQNMSLLKNHLQVVDYMPRQWQHILALYCASRLCTHDERHYQAGTFMNEFETKLDELAGDILSGEQKVFAPDGTEVTILPSDTYVRNNYFLTSNDTVRDYKKWNDSALPDDEDEVIM